MPLAPVNNPPAPVQEQVAPAGGTPPEDPCEALADEFDLETGSHSANTSGSDKLSSTSYQSHHVLQDAATDSLIPRGDALAVMLFDSHRGTEHGTITKLQNARKAAKGGGSGTVPAVTFGELKKQARADLVAGLEGKRKSKITGKPMTKAQAEQAADCLVADAEKKVKDKAKKDGKRITDSTPVKQPGGCFPAGTLVWLAGAGPKPVEAIVPGDWIQTNDGTIEILRVDGCRHDLVEIHLECETITLASFHRVLTHDGEVLRADGCRAGMHLSTASGVRAILAVRHLPGRHGVVRLGLRRSSVCRVGAVGLHTIIPEAGPAVGRTEQVVPMEGGCASCPS